jgi:hypothetical protein
MVMNNSVFWDTEPCSPLKVSRRFGGTCTSIFKAEKETKERIGLKRVASSFGLFLDPEDGGDIFLLNVG